MDKGAEVTDVDFDRINKTMETDFAYRPSSKEKEMTYEQTTAKRIAELQRLLIEVEKGLRLDFAVHGYTRRDQVEQDIAFLESELND